MSAAPLIKHLGLAPYEPAWRAMQRFTDDRDASTSDEIWMVEHPPVFTLGLNASREHVLAAGDIPVVQIDRGGQVTYHGPGQLVIYPLIDLRRQAMGVRQLVMALENAVIAYVAELGVEARGCREAPGVYVGDAKLASIGLRIRRGASYHGMALNVSLDLQPFERINVCGYRGLAVTRLADVCGAGDVRTVADGLAPHLLRHLGFAAAGNGAVARESVPADSNAAANHIAAAGGSEAARDGAAAGDRAPECEGLRGCSSAPARGAAVRDSVPAAAHSAINTDLQAVSSR